MSMGSGLALQELELPCLLSCSTVYLHPFTSWYSSPRVMTNTAYTVVVPPLDSTEHRAGHEANIFSFFLAYSGYNLSVSKQK